jgi:hypothetical protein
VSDPAAKAARKWSEALNELNAWRDERSAKLEAKRQKAMAALPEAAPHLARWRSAVAEAGHARDAALAAATADERVALTDALDGRSTAGAEAEAKYRSGEDKAYARKLDAETRAEAAYEAAIDRARDQHGTTQPYLAARRKAEQVRAAALAEARADYESVKADLDRVRHEGIEKAQREEYTATLAAWSARAKAVAAAEERHRAAIAAADAKLADALADAPGAKAIRRKHAAKTKELVTEYRRREDLLFVELRRAMGRAPK